MGSQPSWRRAIQIWRAESGTLKMGTVYAGGARAGRRLVVGLGEKLSLCGSSPGPLGAGIPTRMLAGAGAMAWWLK
jgi:hypothetical protein